MKQELSHVLYWRIDNMELKFEKINLNSSSWKKCFRLIGLFALIVAALIYGEYKYYNGRLDECIANDGFLMLDSDINLPVCVSSDELVKDGWVIDKESKTISKNTFLYNIGLPE
jgi:hypothetical protein